MKQTKYNIFVLAFFLLALLLAGTADYSEAKETERYSKEQTK